MALYYKLNMKRLPMSLVWSWGGPLKFCAFAIRKAVPVRWVLPGLLPGEPGITQLAEADAPPDLVALLQAPSTQLVAAGFDPITHYSVPAIGLGSGLCRAFISTDGRIAALVLTVGQGARRETGVVAMSLPESGSLIGTSSFVQRLPAVPGINAIHMPRQAAPEVISAHRARIAGCDVKVLKAGAVLDLVLDQQQRSLQYYSAQGLYVPATQQDIDRALGTGSGV